ncbi:hypothetical protein [Streptomyces sp. KMM 9044]|uniref:hypothetical protein n=1 Tax=Streptomyces sp. KMM 9044 TaxID=2744474 RepID=UPI00215152D3|nr:hypothetical protein [Streptomyces sp. KMM 9044]WAX80495.1 hypothetical protein HUV60_025360 [Streptomyces sp. KMM 9044]
MGALARRPAARGHGRERAVDGELPGPVGGEGADQLAVVVAGDLQMPPGQVVLDGPRFVGEVREPR